MKPTRLVATATISLVMIGLITNVQHRNRVLAEQSANTIQPVALTTAAPARTTSPTTSSTTVAVNVVQMPAPSTSATFRDRRKVTRIGQITAKGIDAPINAGGVNGVADEINDAAAKTGVYSATTDWNPGEVELCDAHPALLAGHRTVETHPFAAIGELATGEMITITTDATSCDYRIDKSEVMLERDAAMLEDAVASIEVPKNQNKLYLVSCSDADGNPGSVTHRLIVTATKVAK